MTRIHHLTIQTSKQWFVRAGILLDVRGGLRRADAIAEGMTPLIVCELSVEGQAFRVAQVCTEASPLSPIAFLWHAWRDAASMRGLPDVLKVGADIAAAAPELDSALQLAGVKLEVVTGADKRYGASKKYAHTQSVFMHDDVFPDPIPGTVALANAFLQSKREWGLPVHYIQSGKAGELERAWLDLPHRAPGPRPAVSSPGFHLGPWLWSTERSVPPLTDLMRLVDVTAEAIEEDEVRNAEPRKGYLRHRQFYHVLERRPHSGYGLVFESIEEIQALMPAWPLTTAGVAKIVGMRNQDLQWYLAGRQQVDVMTAGRLLRHFGLETADDGSAYRDCVGPYLLIARSGNIKMAYDTITHGGDAEFAVELLPGDADAALGWRFVLSRTWGEHSASILAFPDTDAGHELLTSEAILGGRYEAVVNASLYRAAWRCFQSAQSDLEAALARWAEFQRRNAPIFDELASKYGTL